MQGVGPRTLATLHRLGLSSRSEAASALSSGRNRRVSAAQVQRIQAALSQSHKPAIQLAHAEAVGGDLLEWLMIDEVWRVEFTGALRRREETVNRIELLAGTKDLAAVDVRLRNYRLAETVSRRGPDQWFVNTTLGFPVLVHATDSDADFPWRWLVTTGMEKHIEGLQQRPRTGPAVSRLSVRRLPESSTGTERLCRKSARVYIN